MTSLSILRTPLLLLASAWTLSAGAVEYTAVAADQSRVSFRFQQMGVAMDGEFKKFSARLRFDPARPAAAQAQIDIDLASIDTGSAEADEEVAGKAWFHVQAHPTASFVARTIQATGKHQYEVQGQLSIKGRNRDVRFALRYEPRGQAGVFSGGFVIRRADFAIGEGIWSKFDVVANDIQVNFQLTAVTGH